MKKALPILIVSLALSGFAQTANQGLNIIAPIPVEMVQQYEMHVVIYNQATRSCNDDIKKLTDAGWNVHSILPFGWRMGGRSITAYQEDLLIVFIRLRNGEQKNSVAEVCGGLCA